MNWKEFLKPYLQKIIWFFIIGVCGYTVFLITPLLCSSLDIYTQSGIGVAFISMLETSCNVSTLFVWVFFLPYKILEVFNVQVEFSRLFGFPHFIVNAVYWYLLTCLLYVVIRNAIKKIDSYLSKSKFIQSLIEPEG